METLMRHLLMVPQGIMATIIIVLSVLISWVLVGFARRHKSYSDWKGDNEFVGFTYAVYGLIYGVVLAFTIVTAWEHFSDAEQLVMHETALVSELAREARAFPSQSGIEIQKDLLAYTVSVVEEEWPEMAHHGRLSVKTQAVYEDLWRNSYAILPETANQTAFLSEYLDRINQLSAARRMRMMYSRARVHNVLWLVMVAGAFPLVGYTLILCTKHTWIHISITAAMTGLVVLCLYVAASLQLPFSGSVAVDVQPFEDLRTSLEKRIAPLLEKGDGT